MASEPVSPQPSPSPGPSSNGSPAPAVSASGPGKPGRGKRPFIILGVVATLAAAGYGTYRWLTAGKESTDNAAVEADVVPVAARAAGTVLHIAVHDNQQVHKDDIILELDPADFAVRVKAAEADLEAAVAQAAAADAQVRIVDATSHGSLSTARAQLSGSAVSVRSAGAQVDVARAQVERAQADAAKARADLARMRSLAASGAATQGQVDDAQATLERFEAAATQAAAQLIASQEQRHDAESRVAEARGRLDQSAPVDAQLEQARASAALAHARVKSAEANLERARLDLGHATLRSPGDGLISRLAVQEGQLVQAGQLVVDLVPSATYVIANFKETQIAHIHPGQRAEIEIDAFGGTYEGKVDSIAAATGARFSLMPPDNASGNFIKVVQRVPVKITWTKPPKGPLVAGLSADVTVFIH